MQESPTDITVLGAGSWGTALAIHLARKGYHVTLWGHKLDSLEQMREQRCNERYLPGIAFPEHLQIGGSWQCAQFETDVPIILAVPSVAFRQVLTHLKPRLPESRSILWGTKGLDAHSQDFFSTVVEETLGNSHRYAVLSGPSFAKEVAKEMPTAIVIASAVTETADYFAKLFASHYFRTYVSDDMVGVQFAGAAKNIIAIAVGISDGLGFGANARSALITRGLAEITRLGLALGAKQETFLGLAGVGDLVLTCTDDQSRNRRLGLSLGRGDQPQHATRVIAQSVEGVHATDQLMKLASLHGIDIPITTAVHHVLHRHCTPAEAVEILLSRTARGAG